MLCNALVLCDSEVLARQIGVTGRAVARAAKGPGSGGVGGASAGTSGKGCERVGMAIASDAASVGEWSGLLAGSGSARTLGGDVTFLGGPVNNLGGLGE